MAFATVQDVEARWRTLSDDEQTRATALLNDASAMLASMMGGCAKVQGKEPLLNMVCCNMVIRAMSASAADSFGVSQASITAGPYTQSFSYANPGGDMYLTRAERRMLGISAGYIGTIEPRIGGTDD